MVWWDKKWARIVPLFSFVQTNLPILRPTFPISLPQSFNKQRVSSFGSEDKNWRPSGPFDTPSKFHSKFLIRISFFQREITSTIKPHSRMLMAITRKICICIASRQVQYSLLWPMTSNCCLPLSNTIFNCANC